MCVFCFGIEHFSKSISLDIHFQDAPNGVKAAIAAGCQVVMVPEDYVTAEMRKEATYVVNTLEEFKPELFGLPSFDD